MDRELDLESLDGGFDATLARGLSLFGGGGGVWFSDGNHRTNAAAGITQRSRDRFFVGAYGRTLAYERTGSATSLPTAFACSRALAGYQLEGRRWDGRLSAGLGAQQIGRAGIDAERMAHRGARLAGAGARATGSTSSGAATNSAVSSHDRRVPVSHRGGVGPGGDLAVSLAKKPRPLSAISRPAETAPKLETAAHLEEPPAEGSGALMSVASACSSSTARLTLSAPRVRVQREPARRGGARGAGGGPRRPRTRWGEPQHLPHAERVHQGEEEGRGDGARVRLPPPGPYTPP